VLGDEKIDEAVFSGQFLTVPTPDNYESLPKKFLEALVAVRREFGKVGTLKIDDDAQFHAEPGPAVICAASKADAADLAISRHPEEAGVPT
jgi:hypothetical protein